MLWDNGRPHVSLFRELSAAARAKPAAAGQAGQGSRGKRGGAAVQQYSDGAGAPKKSKKMGGDSRSYTCYECYGNWQSCS